MTGRLVIPGAPVQQGSKKPGRVYIKDGKPRASVIDDNGPSLKAWRSRGLAAIREQHPNLTSSAPLYGRHVPVVLRVRFVFPLRVADRATIRRNDRELIDYHATCFVGCVHRPWHTVTPDKDKCLRALFDLLTLGHVWADDGQCCRFEVLAYRAEAPLVAVDWSVLST